MKEFTEDQRITKGTFYWVIVVLLNGLALYAFLQQIVWEKPFGNHPMTDNGLTIVLAITILVSILLSRFRLRTRIDNEGVHVALSPIHGKMKTHSWESIQHVSVRQYKPLMDYGGWGIRYSIHGNRAYSLYGNKGIELTFQNGKKLMIGTSRFEELQQFIQEHEAAKSKV